MGVIDINIPQHITTTSADTARLERAEDRSRKESGILVDYVWV